MEKFIFAFSMLIYGFISRINFIVRYGQSSDIDISRVNMEEKYLQSKLSVVAFFLYLATIIWGFINLFWALVLSIMIGGLFIGGVIVNITGFSRLVAVKWQMEFFIVLVSLYLWRESIISIFK